MNIQNIDSSTPFLGLMFKDHAIPTGDSTEHDKEKEQEATLTTVNFSMNAVTAGQNALQNKQNAILEQTKMAISLVEDKGNAARAAAAKQGDALLDQLQTSEVDNEMQVVLDSMQQDIEAAAEKALETRAEQALTEEPGTTVTPESAEQANGQNTENAPQNAAQGSEQAPQNPSGTSTPGIRTQALSREAENLAAQGAASANSAAIPDPATGAIRNSAALKEHKPLNIIV